MFKYWGDSLRKWSFIPTLGGFRGQGWGPGLDITGPHSIRNKFLIIWTSRERVRLPCGVVSCLCWPHYMVAGWLTLRHSVPGPPTQRTKPRGPLTFSRHLDLILVIPGPVTPPRWVSLWLLSPVLWAASSFIRARQGKQRQNSQTLHLLLGLYFTEVRL